MFSHKQCQQCLKCVGKCWKADGSKVCRVVNVELATNASSKTFWPFSQAQDSPPRVSCFAAFRSNISLPPLLCFSFRHGRRLVLCLAARCRSTQGETCISIYDSNIVFPRSLPPRVLLHIFPFVDFMAALTFSFSLARQGDGKFVCLFVCLRALGLHKFPFIRFPLCHHLYTYSIISILQVPERSEETRLQYIRI